VTHAKFKFVSDAITGGDQFTVVRFSGRERVSEFFRYEMEVKAPLSADINLDDVLVSGARFISEQNGFEFLVNGILCSFEAFKTRQNYTHYKAVLVPKIWQLSNYKANEIFYEAGVKGEVDAGQTIAEIIAQVLDKADMVETTDYKLNGISQDNTLLKREYVCQYNESNFNFISRLMKNEGFFYYFEQSSSGEVIVFLNDQDYDDLPPPKLIFDAAAMSQTQSDCLVGWSYRKQRLPQTVIVRDYNAEEASLDVSDITTIDDKGQGTEYWANEVNHEGHGLGQSKSSNGQKALRSQHRPALKTQKPRITGTLPARIDGKLDSEGRYKVSLPFDCLNENHSGGLALASIHMIQPYTGKNYMHING
jgi:type VI secretion system secreted protein VgrG